MTIDDKNHFDEVCNLLKHIKIDYQLSPSLVRGLDYYTRTTFEITSNELGAQNAICGGGRYDGLVEKLGGKPTPGIGFAAGIERATKPGHHRQGEQGRSSSPVGATPGEPPRTPDAILLGAWQRCGSIHSRKREFPGRR